MAYGDGPDDVALRRAWETFCYQVKAAGQQIFKEHNPASELHRVDALRFLTQNLGQAFDLALETRDTRYPGMHAFCGPTRKLGGDCADFTYQQAWIDGDSVYRIHGERGTARFFNITVQGPRPDGPGVLHEPFGDVPEASLAGAELAVDHDGTFEVFLGGAPRASNWLPTTAGSRKLFVRQGFDSWDEIPARIAIERVDMAEPKPLPTAQQMVDAIAWAGDFLTGVMGDWPEFPFTHGGVDADAPNRFPAVVSTDGDTKRGRAAVNMHWVLTPDEALVIEFDAHDGFWSLTNMGVFFNSMDFRYRPVSYTASRTAVDTDGKVRLVLAHTDPGFHNWIDTQGFERGNVTYRHMLDGAPVPLRTEVVKHSELAGVLPADTATVTAEERRAQMRVRFDAVGRRYTAL
ncbi:DUF1214 domain-containing protein [Mycolicibacterium sp. PAM1]|uniref:DUF1214 domain-containing protein n=1 Tax=Mycolicibacterium gilvum (strain PYR-GCK) TaxID=350054 RepID=A4T828_MYCGI|nr:DUF1214 domain-containing protein [Mycolicibacterium sp. PAM1]ABP44973.1 conserved hypothetical protein [Mycolicibacterium gilvum PYR-GCK]MBV5243008.1 DUF1214 domain-containing protein [Mycolicibacterium sp. PAM1]